MRAVHAPQNAADLLPTSPVRARLAFDELLANQLAMRMVRHSAAEATPGRAYCGDGHITSKLRASLPYEMTGAQNRAIDEITSDQAKPKRMLRMLQGDVGSGKNACRIMGDAKCDGSRSAGRAFGTNRGFGAPASCQHPSNACPA